MNGRNMGAGQESFGKAGAVRSRHYHINLLRPQTLIPEMEDSSLTQAII